MLENKRTRLSQLRDHLDRYNTQPAKAFSWSFESIRLLILRNDLKILSVTHPYYKFENAGDYNGYIRKAEKPDPITITFMEVDKHFINTALMIWDAFKYNPSTGIVYPKAVYSDVAKLTYNGAADDTGRIGGRVTRSYLITGFYPIQTQTVSLDYATNDVVKISVDFNVDSITPLAVI